MGEVIRLPQPAEYILQCDCNHAKFHIHENGVVECARCHSTIISVVARWISEVPKE